MRAGFPLRIARTSSSGTPREMERETGQAASEADAFEEMIDHALVSWQRPLAAGESATEHGEEVATSPGTGSRVKLHLLSRLWRLPEVVEVEPLVGVVVAAALEVACVGF